MRWAPEESPLVRLLLLAFTPLVLAALVLSHLAPEFLLKAAHCPLREVTGLPCPTCGGTLAATRLAAGQWRSGVAANPLVALALVVYAAAAIWALCTTIYSPWQRRWQLTGTEKRTAKWLAVLLLLANWIWLMFRYLG